MSNTIPIKKPELITVDTIKPFTRFCCSIGMIPSSYKASMSYDEQLMWLCHFLEDTLLPTVNTNTESFLEIEALFEQLHDYVEHYFDNLDVQQEINNKLDEMVEDGTLENIVGGFINEHFIQYFDTVADLKNANLSSGQIAGTKGYYSVNDGGGAKYHIVNDNTLVDDGGSVIDLNNGLKAKLFLNNINNTINVRQFGAYGDNIHDDTLAFKNANTYITNLVNQIQYNQSIWILNIQLEIPYGQYYLKGSNILGSIIQSDTTNYKTFGYRIIGNNASLFWHVENEQDNLFYFDYTISNPSVEDLEILTINDDAETTTYYGNIFNIKSVNINGTYYGSTSHGFFSKLRVVGIRNNNNITNRPYSIFNVSGATQCDQSLVLRCQFVGFKHIITSSNSQAVNWVFSSISAHTQQANAIYFNIEKCDDNFVVENSAFSIFSTQILLKAWTPLNSNNKNPQAPYYNFQFLNNRIELIGILNDTNEWYPCFMNYGKLILKGTSLLLGGQSQNIKSIFYLKSHGTLNMENVTLNNSTFIIPCIDDEISGIGNYDTYGINVLNCNYLSYEFKVNYNDTLYDLIDTFAINGAILRQCHFENFARFASHRKYTFDIIGNREQYINNIYTISYSNNSGVALGENILIPPFQTIKRVSVNIGASLPTAVNKIRIYFGNKENEDYIEKDYNPSQRNYDFELFKGMASIIDSLLTNQYIYVCLINSSNNQEVTSIVSSVELTYLALAPRSHFNKTTDTQETIIRT